MEDTRNIVAGLSPEQVLERAQALQFELDYWQRVAADCATITAALRDATMAVLDSTADLLGLLPLADAAGVSACESAIRDNRESVAAIEVAANAVNGIVELADGRMTALRPVVDAILLAAGVDPDGASTQGST